MASEPLSLPNIIDHSGNVRPLGFLPGDPGRMMAVPALAEADLIPEANWVEFHEWPEHIKIKDQNGRGACNGFAAALGTETTRYVAGMPHIPLSGWYVYSILCNGVDRGSMILDALELLQERGCSPEDQVKYGVINPRQLTAEAHKEAPRFKVEIGERLTTYQQLGTAIQRRQSINLAVCVGNAFNNLNSDGVPQLGRSWCNHAVHVGLGMKRAKDGSWLALMANSWTTQWGQNGFCWLPLKYIPTASAFEAYTLRAVVDDTADNTKPPDLIA
jgi:hypothetical protein